MKKLFDSFNLLRISLAVLIMAIPLYPKFPLADVSGIYVNIRLDDILVAISASIWLIYQLKNGKAFIKKPIFLIFLAYTLSLLLAALGNILIHRTDPVNLILLHTIRRLEYISVFFVTLSALETKKANLKYYLIFFVVALIGIDLYGLGQKFLSFPVVSTMNEEFSKGQILTISVWTRINSTFAGHYDLAVYMSVALVVLLGILVLSKNVWQKIMLISVWLLSFYVLTLTASRISIFAFWGGAIICLMLVRKWLWILPVTAIVVFSIFNSQELNQRLAATIPTLKNISIRLPNISFLNGTSKGTISLAPSPTATIVFNNPGSGQAGPIVTARPGEPTPTINRIRPTEEYPKVDADLGVARSGEIRFQVEWPRALRAFEKNILVGTGPGSIGLATDNEYLRILGETGIIGIANFLIIFLFFTCLTKTTSIKNDRPLKYVFFSAMVTMLANAIFIDVFAASKTAYTFWIMMGFYYYVLTNNTEAKK